MQVQWHTRHRAGLSGPLGKFFPANPPRPTVMPAKAGTQEPAIQRHVYS